MPDTNPPFVRVVVINFDGGPVTLRCLDALLASEYPRDRMEIVLVDNASVDGLNWVIKERYPDVVLIESDVNEGFARGCNLGIGDLTGVDLVALVNNDAIVEPDWVWRLLEGFTDERVGAVVPKLLLNIHARTVLVRSERLDTDEEGRCVGVKVHAAVLNGDRQGLADAPEIRYDERFWPDDHTAKAPLAAMWWESEPGAPPDELTLQLSSRTPTTATIGEPGHEITVEVGPTPVTVEFTLRDHRRIVNSAGGALYTGWFGGDRGFLEPDIGQYDEPADVFSWCGGATLLRADYLREVGLFDPTYFLYYEDFDLSWRGRSAGWAYRYQPAATVFHEHAYSSKAGSEFFNYWVDRNRRLTLVKNAPAGVALRAVAGSIPRVTRFLARHTMNQARRLRPPSPTVVGDQLAGYWRFVRALPRALRERRRIARASTVSRQSIASWTVHK